MAIKVLAVTLLSASAWAFPSQQKFKPLIDACDGLGELAQCSATFDGVCKTSEEDGSRFCGHEHHHDGGVFHTVARLAKKYVFGGHKHWHHVVGDCESKQDGEKCSFAKTGKCVNSGKCPIFQGQMVCKPTDAHPPKFITEPCQGKEVGDRCFLKIVPGACTKGKYEEQLVCRAGWGTFWGSSSSDEAAVNDQAAVVV